MNPSQPDPTTDAALKAAYAELRADDLLALPPLRLAHGPVRKPVRRLSHWAMATAGILLAALTLVALSRQWIWHEVPEAPAQLAADLSSFALNPPMPMAFLSERSGPSILSDVPEIGMSPDSGAIPFL